jgi:excisionase family DNA binding protein
MADANYMKASTLLSTGEVAARIGTSRQHVVDLCNTGRLRHTTVGKHRRIASEDITEFMSGSSALRKEQIRSLWLNTAAAGKLVVDPAHGLEIAQRNLARMRERDTRGHQSHWIDQWEDLVSTNNLSEILHTLTAQTGHAAEMRQNTPFAGLLTQTERDHVLANFYGYWRQCEEI